ncbi:MAG: tRNA (guanine(26)-N(2))-dimethyltransferase, partial [Halobacteriota archaeon]
REPVWGLAPPLPDTCPACDAPVKRIGPLWLDRYADEELVGAVGDALDDSMGERVAAERLLARLQDELDVVGHYDHHAVCDRLDVPAGPITAVIEGLREQGYRASRTHFGGTTFKTDAPTRVVHDVVSSTADSA